MSGTLPLPLVYKGLADSNGFRNITISAAGRAAMDRYLRLSAPLQAVLLAHQASPNKTTEAPSETPGPASSSPALPTTLRPTTHAKKSREAGRPVPWFVVTLDQKLDQETYQSVAETAKRHGGFWSSYKGQGAIPGFQFARQDQAQAFQAALKAAPKTPAETTPAPATSVLSPTERTALIDRIVAARRARTPMPAIAPSIELKGDNGNWYSPNGFPHGVNSTGEKRIVGYALIDPKRGVAFGAREATEQALVARWNANQAATEAEFRRELEANSESQLQDQAAYWLKGHQKFAAAPTPAAVTDALKAISSDATVQRLVDAGNLRVVARQAALPRHAAIPPGQRVAGWVDPDTGGVYLIAENITPEEVTGLLAHEIGVHQAQLGLNQPKPAALRLAHTLVGLLGGRGLLGEPAFNDVLAQLERMRAAGNVRVKAAFAEAETAVLALNQNPDLIPEEALAYLVQSQPQLSLVQRFMTMVRAALYRMGFRVNLTDADLHALALAAVRRAGDRTERAPDLMPQAAILARAARAQQQDGGEFLAVALRFIGQDATLFQSPIAHSRDLPGILQEIAPKVTLARVIPSDELKESGIKGVRPQEGYELHVPIFNKGGQPATASVYFFRGGKGGQAVWVDFSELTTGSGGNRLYMAAADWAFNNGWVFMGDPAGLSDIAKIRRTEIMLSSAVKHGTTRHLWPHEKQGIDWKGQDDLDFQALIKKAMDNVLEHIPHLKAIRYDFDRRGFVDGDDQAFTDADFRTLANTRAARTVQAGSATLKRNAFLRTLSSAGGGAGPGGGRSVLAAIARELHQSVATGGLKGTFYGQAPQDTEAARQYAEVVARYTLPDGTKAPGWMKAPNGQPTKLNERQWVQTRTPAFKEWFGDWENDPAHASQVTDGNGEPLVVYHGTRSDISEFSQEYQGKTTEATSAKKGFFFASKPRITYGYLWPADRSNQFALLFGDSKGPPANVHPEDLLKYDRLYTEKENIEAEISMLNKKRGGYLEKPKTNSPLRKNPGCCHCTNS